MKIISTTLARTVWVFDLARVNAKGRSLLDVIQATGVRYRFAKFPQHLLDINKDQALEFNSGTFVKGGLDLRVGLTLYNNAAAADSLSSTENSEIFLEDLAAWLRAEHDIDMKADLKRKMYVSQINVQPNAALPLWNPALAFVLPKIASLATAIDGQPRQYTLDGISAYPQDAGQQLSPVQFQLDRKWSTDPSENIYFSQAPMSTREHIALLNEIESRLLGLV